MIKTYSELRKLRTFEERFEYLILGGHVGEATFGFDRYINQTFYTSQEWRSIRQHVILRDNGCDLGIRGHEINSSVVVHHMNPMNSEDIIHGADWILDPEFLVLTSHDTHNAIHYGDRSKLKTPYVERTPGDTRLW